MTGNAKVLIRPATPQDCDALTSLALRSKAHWGYDAEFMIACRDELTVTPNLVDPQLSGVCEQGGDIAGFYLLTKNMSEQRTADLRFLFVDPGHIGTGVGALLWGHMVRAARRGEIGTIGIEADPNAEGFYRRRGAVTVGNAPSGSVPGRHLPLMEYHLS